jgi:hypothetical protein
MTGRRSLSIRRPSTRSLGSSSWRQKSRRSRRGRAPRLNSAYGGLFDPPMTANSGATAPGTSPIHWVVDEESARSSRPVKDRTSSKCRLGSRTWVWCDPSAPCGSSSDDLKAQFDCGLRRRWISSERSENLCCCGRVGRALPRPPRAPAPSGEDRDAADRSGAAAFSCKQPRFDAVGAAAGCCCRTHGGATDRLRRRPRRC